MTHHAALQPLLDQVCQRIAPAWPLQNFVAVNPFTGLADLPFAEASALLEKVAHPGILMPLTWFASRHRSGHLSQLALEEVIRETAGSPSMEQILRAFDSLSSVPPAPCLSIAEILDRRDGSAWATFATDEVSKWCAAYYDQGQSSWTMPWRDQPLYNAWKHAAETGRNPEMMGLKRFRKSVASLPADPHVAIELMLASLQIPQDRLADFLHHQLVTVNGWAGHLQYRLRQKSAPADLLVQLLAIRLAYDYALSLSFMGDALDWESAAAVPADSAIRLVCQQALELDFQKALTTRLASVPATADRSGLARRDVQAVFCIDVRSELPRRWLESLSPGIETLGFAGFFGFALESLVPGEDLGSARCPVLLNPRYRIEEIPGNAKPAARQALISRRRISWQMDRVLQAFKTSPVSSFSFVETAGLLHGARLLLDSFALNRPNPAAPFPGISADQTSGTGIPAADRAALAESALRGMGLISHFARLVLICGHGGDTCNNPHASSLDCGACGGHPGGLNARVAAAVLNDPLVRLALRPRGIDIPDDTLFISGLHHTTTDTFDLHDPDLLPLSHQQEISQLEAWLHLAGRLTRDERAPRLGLPSGMDSAAISRAITARSRDGSQVRPEWALAGNAAFIAAPRERTRGLDLGGRVFLHNYRSADDPDSSILELILCAPVIVASWINLQYYASTVNPSVFGGGNKVLHNITSAFGVIEGNSGDLRTGLPFQSVHDGGDLIHEPLRLHVFIEAETGQLDAILRKHDHVRHLFEHGWLHLFSLEPGGPGIRRRVDGHWREII
jgi:uncharacterized protein